MDAVASAPRLRLPAPRRALKLRSDAALVDRFQSGDEAAFAVLYDRHRATVLAVCMGVLGSRHDAEDAAQEAFASLTVALRTAPPRDMRSWLARVARNASIDLARRKRDRPAPETEMHQCVASESSDEGALEVVLEGVRQLPEAQRTALLMRELAGHTYLEIAALLGTDEDGVRGLIARARVGLRNHREAAELPCASARAAVCAEPDRRRLDKTARRHLRSCASCRSYLAALRSDARALRGLAPVEGGTALGGGAVAGLLAKGAVMGTVASQAGAACAVSVCALGGFVLLYGHSHHHAMHSAASSGKASAALHRAAIAGGGASSPARGQVSGQAEQLSTPLSETSRTAPDPSEPGASVRAHAVHDSPGPAGALTTSVVYEGPPPPSRVAPGLSDNPGSDGSNRPADGDSSRPGRGSSPWAYGQGDARPAGGGEGQGDARPAGAGDGQGDARSPEGGAGRDGQAASAGPASGDGSATSLASGSASSGGADQGGYRAGRGPGDSGAVGQAGTPGAGLASGSEGSPPRSEGGDSEGGRPPGYTAPSGSGSATSGSAASSVAGYPQPDAASGHSA